jgi:hypothetical protein
MVVVVCKQALVGTITDDDFLLGSRPHDTSVLQVFNADHMVSLQDELRNLGLAT